MKKLLRRIDDEIVAAGGKRSRSRALVIETFFRSRSHVSVEELTRDVRRREKGIGAATVYRTLRLMSRLGYAKEIDFGDRIRRYESSLQSHHDHLVCIGCGGVSEFKNVSIEEHQDRVARQHGFRAKTHRLEIYGLCRDCSKDGGGEAQ